MNATATRDDVYTTSFGKKITIDMSLEIARGGEGAVVTLPNTPGYVAKIYHVGIKPISKEKFTVLEKLDENYFVKPKSLLFNSKNKVAGFIMEYLDQSFFQISTIFSKQFCKQNKIDGKIKRKMLEKLISAVKYAHDNNIIIGDLNPYNIMVNKAGVIKFIDVDSYGTMANPHNGIMLEDIRDFYYQGRVTFNSDFFALGVLTFNMLSFTHPFKGIHKKFRKTADRMINKLPVFLKDSDIIVPKSYEEIKDKNLMSQYKRMFVNVERFLLSTAGIDTLIATSPLAKPSLVKKYEQDELIITVMLANENINNIYFLDSKGIIETDSEYIEYDSSNKGYVLQKAKYSKKEWQGAFVGEKNIITLKGSKLYHEGDELTNFKIPKGAIAHQFRNILVIIGEDTLYKLFIDQIAGSTIKMDSLSVFDKGFSVHGGFINNTGGNQNIFYADGRDITTVMSPLRMQSIFQDRNVGVVSFFEKNKVKYKFFKIKDMKMQVSKSELDGMSNFAFIPGTREGGFIMKPCDDRIEMYRIDDFEKIGEMNCDLATAQSTIQNTNAGLIIWDDSGVHLLNKK